jgi:GDP-L-fucose synthase
MKVLVTGSSGLVGHALQEVISRHQDDYTYVFLSSKDGDLTKEEAVKTIFEMHQPDCVIHLAANVGGLFKNMHQKSQMLEDNLMMNTLVLKYAHVYKISKVILILSTCIFPDGIVPLTEDKLHIGPPHPSNEGYSYAKRIMEVHARILSDQYNIATVCMTPTNLFGEYDNFDLQNAHVLPALIRKCCEAKEKKEPFVVCGSGKPLRQFLYSQDFAEMIWQVLHDDTLKKEHFICSPPSSLEVSIEYVAKKVATCVDYEYALTFDTSFADGQYKKTVEPNIYFKDFNFTSFDHALEKTVQWYLKNEFTLP